MAAQNEFIIEAENLNVSFTVQRHGISSIKDFIISLGIKTPFEKKSVLRNFNFQVRRGECVGIMGRNGCGKSTLLRTIAGIMPPDSGKIRVDGAVAPLMTLGAGLEPELTGRENINLVATLIGLSKKEIRKAMGAIIDFSELSQDEIDMQVKRYSSGMISRLAFAIAVANTPEILIIDEALAVGDLGFRQKCGRRITEIKEGGSTILYVSHHYDELKSICSRAILLEDGKIAADGTVDEIFHQYEKILVKE
jgi:ABC-type polysaccharide/polyol phosphate transport system ATPase subunit